MCKSQREGGQRCAAHTRARFNSTPMDDPNWDEVAFQYASTPEGERVIGDLAYEAQESNDWHTEGRYRSVIARGEAIREANRAAAALMSDHPVGSKINGFTVSYHFDGCGSCGARVVPAADTSNGRAPLPHASEDGSPCIWGTLVDPVTKENTTGLL